MMMMMMLMIIYLRSLGDIVADVGDDVGDDADADVVIFAGIVDDLSDVGDVVDDVIYIPGAGVVVDVRGDGCADVLDPALLRGERAV